MPIKKKLLDNDSTVPVTGSWLAVPSGVYKLSVETSDGSAQVAIETRIDGGAAMAFYMPAALTSSLPNTEISIGEDEEIRATRADGSGAVTVHIHSMTRI